MKENIQLSDELRAAVKAIKKAILQSQYRAAKIVNREQLSLYYGITISLEKCIKKYTTHLAQAYIVHTGDIKEDGDYLYIPLYMVPCL